MPSFEEILNTPASDIKPPEAYPVGTYHCLIVGPPTPGKSSQKQTDYLRFEYKILAPFKDVDTAKAAEQQVVGKSIHEDYYITGNAEWRLKDMLKNADISEEGKTLREMISEAPGKQILVTLRHEASQDGKRVFHRVNGTAHV